MKNQLLVLLALSAFSAAMVPPERRVNSEEMEAASQDQVSSSTTPKNICAPHTPCAWSVYKSQYKIIEEKIENTYCVCDANLECQIHEDDTSGNAYIHRCRPPKPSTEESESEHSER